MSDNHHQPEPEDSFPIDDSIEFDLEESTEFNLKEIADFDLEIRQGDPTMLTTHST